ncbi:GSCFA domain-containing protein [Aureibaculum sp. 2210JD6-5]|uniref:GSCFA domain-containing protein n=1 Tax=Aureibaculum sp. 2210JD6-5 TaxID=3103957 RepID=UPI002AAC8F68|nr:GSCFA domain-containing protein [Aureibaculum sp. 2210JD6-5]MDY7394909.1 GSCFA domain-containing protein [Aureibaculum sp. 2210JD6-5]
MKLKTEIPTNKHPEPITYDSNIIMIGSCFSDNIGDKLNYYKFKNFVNPNGILFNPVSIENVIKEAIDKKQYHEDDLFHYDGLWHSFNHHSKFSGPTPELKEKNENVIEFYEALKKVTHIFITLGTAWVYRYLKTNEVVANCHKIPQKKFKKELLSVAEIEKSLGSILELVKSVNKSISVTFTVSPVRHLKDGFVENQLSKAHLLTAIHKIIKGNDVAYFPAYEIMMDDLRDYRFYKEDMVHPNKLAINYIWEKFTNAFMTEDTIKTMSEIEQLQKELGHRPIHPQSENHKKFIVATNKKLLAFREKYPAIKF